MKMIFPTAARLRHSLVDEKRRNRVAVGAATHLLPRVAEAATPGSRTKPLCGTRRMKGIV